MNIPKTVVNENSQYIQFCSAVGRKCDVASALLFLGGNINIKQKQLQFKKMRSQLIQLNTICYRQYRRPKCLHLQQRLCWYSHQSQTRNNSTESIHNGLNHDNTCFEIYLNIPTLINISRNRFVIITFIKNGLSENDGVLKMIS